MHSIGGMTPGDDWKRVTAHDTLESCKVGTQTTARQLYGMLKGAGSWDVVEHDMLSVTGRKNSGEQLFATVECWPDTVDPRRK